MARQESDREDLFEEFRSAVQKWEIRLPNVAEIWVIGVRGDERLSIYYGPDPCYHFDPSGRLLRAYVDGALYRTQGKTLARMVRVRTPEVTQLERHDLTIPEVDVFRARMISLIDDLLAAIEEGNVEIMRSKSDDTLQSIVSPRLQTSLALKCEFAPAYPTRR